MMCEHANCDHSREDIARLVVEPKGRRATATNASHDGGQVRSPSPAKERDISYEFVLRKVETPRPREIQSDIRPYFATRKQTREPSAAAETNPQQRKKLEPNNILTVTPEQKPADKNSISCSDLSKSRHSDKEDEEDKKPAALTSQVFLKYTSEGNMLYVPVALGASEWDCLPRGVYLANDLDGTDPNRIVVVVDEDADEVPDFILDSIPIPPQENNREVSK